MSKSAYLLRMCNLGSDIVREKSELLLSKEEIDAMVAATSGRKNSMRDSLIINLFRYTGIRLNELRSLSINQFSWNDHTVHIIGSKAKMNEDRVIPVEAKTLQLVRWYVDQRGLKGKDHLFDINNREIQYLVRYYVKAAGITHPVTCHDFRRYFITHSLVYHPIFTVMKWSGHRHVSTTQIYYKLPSLLESKGYDEHIDKL